jgi:hypothetical protein
MLTHNVKGRPYGRWGATATGKKQYARAFAFFGFSYF